MHCHLVEIERRRGPLGLGLAWSVLQDLTKKIATLAGTVLLNIRIRGLFCTRNAF